MRILDDAVRQATWDLAEQQNAWIVEQARLLGITVEELVEDYYLEVENLGPELTPVPEGDAVIYSARQQIRLRRRDDQARMSKESGDE